MLPRRSEPDEYVHGTVAWAIGRIGPAAEPAIPDLIGCLGAELDGAQRAQSVHGSARRNAAWALGQFGPAARVAVPELAKLLDDEDPVVRVQAAAALWRIDRHAKAAATLLEMLRARKGNGSFAAAVALGELGPDVPGALEALVEALGHPDEDTQRAASRSLKRLEQERKAKSGEPSALHPLSAIPFTSSPSRPVTPSTPGVGSIRDP
jgi:HEAT repeat protein